MESPRFWCLKAETRNEKAVACLKFQQLRNRSPCFAFTTSTGELYDGSSRHLHCPVTRLHMHPVAPRTVSGRI